MCKIADMNPNPDDLLILLAVSRSGKFTTAAQALGLNHTTVSRRIAALEKALGGRVLARAAGGWEVTELGAEAVHVEATRAGAGVGFLPCFMADRHADLVRLLPEDFAELLPYWMVLRPDSMRRPAVAAVVHALKAETANRREELLGRPTGRRDDS